MSIRKEQILITAVELAREKSYHKITREAIAERLSISTALISHYFGSTQGLREAVMQKAVSDELLDILCQGLASHHPIAKECPTPLKFKACKYLMNE